MRLPASMVGERLDRAICEALRAKGVDVSVREVRFGLREGRIRVFGRPAAPGARVTGHEAVDLVEFEPRAHASIEPEPALLEVAPVVFLDEDVFALNKPSGVSCLPLRPGERGTLLAAALAVDPAVEEAGPPLEGGLCHRLDRGTSGVTLFARTERSRTELRRAFSLHAIEKRYIAAVKVPGHGLPQAIDLPIRTGETPQSVRVGEGRKALPASSRLQLRDKAADRWIVEVTTRFGRRHQVRAHLAHAGAPIFGDDTYGGPPAKRLMLHAASLLLPDARLIEAPVPADFEGIEVEG